MIKLPDSSRTKALSKALDIIIADYNKIENKKCRILGQPTDNPKITEVDLAAARVKGDIVVAPDVYAYYLDCFDEKKAKAAAAGLYPNSKLLSLSGKFHYPPKGYMGWHTNSNMEGWRVYATYCEEGDKSFFRYFEKNKMLTEYEKKGWNFRAFQVKKSKLYWHCVYSDTNRYSFGFRFQIDKTN